MSLNKQIWIDTVAEVLRQDNSFASKITDYSEYASGTILHIPNAGIPGTLVSKNLTSWPVSAATFRTDVDNAITMDIYYLNPIQLATPVEELQFNYNKRSSVMLASLSELKENIHNGLILDMSVGSTVYTGTGSGRTCLNSAQTGNRSAITYTDVLKVQYLFNSQNIPTEGRYMLVPAELQNDILGMTQFNNSELLTNQSTIDGFVGKIAGFNVILRSTVLLTTSGGTLKTNQTYATSDCAAALFFSTATVFKSVGNIDIYEDIQNPFYMGDIISGKCPAKGGNKFATPKGIAVLAEKTA